MKAHLTPEEEQLLIDIFSEFYSQEDIFAIGRWMGIDPSRYYGFGMNGVQLAQAFISMVKKGQREDDLFQVIADRPSLYREQLKPFLPIYDSNEVRYPKELHAIIIGINEYEMDNGERDLKCPRNDAIALARFLYDEWNVSTSNIHLFVEHTTGDYLRAAIETICESMTENDNLLFYFSGHGMEMDGHSYLVTTDAAFLPKIGAVNFISLSWLNKIIKKCKANVKVRIFDACQCGERFGKVIKAGQEPEGLLTEKMTRGMMDEFLGRGNNWITFCSCNIDEYSFELPALGHGIFTYFLLEGLKGGAKYGRKKLQIEDLKQYICENVLKASVEYLGTAQTPQYQCEMQVNVIME